MKKTLLAFLSFVSINSFAVVGDSGYISTVYFTNSTGEDIKLVSGNSVNNSGYSKFNCLYPIPKKYQDVPSPAFKTMIEPGSKGQSSLQYSLIPNGSTVAYAFDSSCDSVDNSEKNERLYLRSAADYSKLYINLGNMHQDFAKQQITYTTFLNVHAIYGNLVFSGLGIAPLHITALPLK